MKKEHEVEIRKIIEESRVIINKWKQLDSIPHSQIWEDIDGERKIVQMVCLSMLLAAHPNTQEEIRYKIADVVSNATQQYVFGILTDDQIDDGIDHFCESLGLFEVGNCVIG